MELFDARWRQALGALMVGLVAACSGESSASRGDGAAGTRVDSGTGGVSGAPGAGHPGAGGAVSAGRNAGGGPTSAGGSAGDNSAGGSSGGRMPASAGESGGGVVSGAAGQGRGGSGGARGGDGGSSAGGMPNPGGTAGAPGGAAGSNAGAGASAGGGAGPTATFADVQAIFDDNGCIDCHDASKQGIPNDPSLSLIAGDSYAALVNHPADAECGGTRVVPGDPDASFLVHKISDAMPCEGLRMPRGHEILTPPPLSDATIALVRAWILEGAAP